MNKNNNKSKTTKNSVKQLRKEVNSLRRRLTNNAPVAISTKSGNQGKDYYRTKGMERISDVSANSTSYAVTGVFLNAANPSLFPWLSGIAKKYDLYRFNKLIFRYKPSLPTSEAGNVYLGIDYNTLDPAPPTSTDFCQLSHWNTNVVWKPQSLQAKVPSNDWFYTRQGSVPNADYKTYDIGKFFVAVENISYISTVGYIEVEYEVEFARRQPDYVSEQPPVSDQLYTVVRYITPVEAAHYAVFDDTYVYNNSQGDIAVTDTVDGSDTGIEIDKPGFYAVTLNNCTGIVLKLRNPTGTNYMEVAGNSSSTMYIAVVSNYTIKLANSNNTPATTVGGNGTVVIQQIA